MESVLRLAAGQDKSPGKPFDSPLPPATKTASLTRNGFQRKARQAPPAASLRGRGRNTEAANRTGARESERLSTALKCPVALQHRIALKCKVIQKGALKVLGARRHAYTCRETPVAYRC